MKLIYSIGLFIGLGSIIFCLKAYGFQHLVHERIWVIFAFFLALAFFNNQLMKLAFEKNREKFIVFFMASMVGRLILSLMFIVTFLFLKVSNVQLFVINFFVLYLCVLAFEIFENIRNLRQN
jgi:ABC-type uncharacterized transport system permease subunit